MSSNHLFKLYLAKIFDATKTFLRPVTALSKRMKNVEGGSIENHSNGPIVGFGSTSAPWGGGVVGEGEGSELESFLSIHDSKEGGVWEVIFTSSFSWWKNNHLQIRFQSILNLAVDKERKEKI
jgi:hypothetical protein